MTFKCTVKAELLKEIYSNIKDLVDEFVVDITNDGQHICVIDTGHTTLTDMSIPRISFDSFECDNEPQRLGMDVSTFKQICDMIKSGDIVKMDHVDNKMVWFVNKMRFRSHFIDINETKPVKMPNLNLPIKVKLNSNELKDIIKATESFEGSVKFAFDKNIVSVGSSSGLDDIYAFFDHVSDSNAVESYISYTKTSIIVKNIKSDTVDIGIGLNYPVTFKFNMANGGTIYSMVAPRTEV